MPAAIPSLVLKVPHQSLSVGAFAPSEASAQMSAARLLPLALLPRVSAPAKQECKPFCVTKTHGWEALCSWGGCNACTKCYIGEVSPLKLPAEVEQMLPFPYEPGLVSALGCGSVTGRTRVVRDCQAQPYPARDCATLYKMSRIKEGQAPQWKLCGDPPQGGTACVVAAKLTGCSMEPLQPSVTSNAVRSPHCKIFCAWKTQSWEERCTWTDCFGCTE